MMVTFVTFPLHTSHTMSLLLVVVLLLSFHVTYNNGSGDNKRVQELVSISINKKQVVIRTWSLIHPSTHHKLSTLHTHYRCDTPKEGIVYLEDLSSYTYDPGVEWVPRGVVLKTCSDWSGTHAKSLTLLSTPDVHNITIIH